MHSIGDWWLWLVFIGLIATLLSIDLFLLGGKKRHRMSLKKSVLWTSAWIILALLFNIFLWIYLTQTQPLNIANQKALEFFTAYLIEESLSMDNIFVFFIIFKYFSIPIDYQRRLLLFGVIGAIFMRLTLILLGIWLINKFDWILYLFGLLLIYSAIKALSLFGKKQSIKNNIVLRLLRKIFPIDNKVSYKKFIIHENGAYYATPLLVVLIFIEICDLMFAIDSIPAVFGITRDPYIAFTSNAFAILGLRTMYFVLANIQHQFYFLNYGIAIILGFIGIKMLTHHFIEIPVAITLSLIILTLSVSMIASKLVKRKK